MSQCCERDHNHDGNCDRHPAKVVYDDKAECGQLTKAAMEEATKMTTEQDDAAYFRKNLMTPMQFPKCMQENAAHDVVAEHRQRIAGIIGSIRDRLVALGHKCDEELRVVDGAALMVYILPSGDNLRIGYGATGAHEAYTGPETQIPYDEICQKFSTYVAANKP